MEVFRYSRDAFGQPILEGISYDLIWVFAGAAAAIIVGHLVWTLIKHNKD